MCLFSSNLATLPPEIISNIAFHVACPAALGSPESLLPLILTCKAIWRPLATNNHLYSKIFEFKFSHRAIARRAFPPTSTEYFEQLILYSRVLRIVKSGRTHDVPIDDNDPDTDIDIDFLLTTIFLMLLDDDGRNSAQLNHVGTYEYVLKLVKRHLYHEADSNDGWPVENRRNACGLWILWLLTTKERLLAETEEEQDQFVELIFPFVVGYWRYPTSYAPANHLHLPLKGPDLSGLSPDSINTDSPDVQGSPAGGQPGENDQINPRPADPSNVVNPLNPFMNASHAFNGQYPAYLTAPPNAPNPSLAQQEARTTNQPTYGRRLALTSPLIASAAKLLYFSRREMWKVGAPSVVPRTREEAGSRPGPTAEDIEEWNGDGRFVDERYRGGTQVPPVENSWGEEQDLSKGHDTTFNRVRMCWDAWADDEGLNHGESLHPEGRHPLRGRPGPVYVPGSMSGLWVGRMTIPDATQMRSLIEDPEEEGQPPRRRQLPRNLSDMSMRIVTIPVYMRLEEHVVYWSEDRAQSSSAISTTVIPANSIVPCGGPNPTTFAEPSSSWEAEFDQGLLNGWFPEGMEWRKMTDHSSSAQSVPIPGTPAGCETESVELLFPGANGWTGQNKFVYQTISGQPLGGEPIAETIPRAPTASSTSLRQPGRFHDRDRCPGCRIREEEKRWVRAQREARDLKFETQEEDEEVEEDDESEEVWNSVGLGRSQCISPSSSSVSSFIDPDIGPEGPPPQDPYLIPACTGILDLIITGSTDLRHSQAWQPYRYIGRVRAWDGLVGILRVPEALDDVVGKMVFSGYLEGGRNFVGNWRICGGVGVGQIGIEGAFSLGRRG